MPKSKARRLHDTLDPNVPYLTRTDFMDDLAALSAMCPEDVRRVARSTNRPLWRVLWCAHVAFWAHFAMMHLVGCLGVFSASRRLGPQHRTRLCQSWCPATCCEDMFTPQSRQMDVVVV
jgi:hypothetical protein